MFILDLCVKTVNFLVSLSLLVGADRDPIFMICHLFLSQSYCMA